MGPIPSPECHELFLLGSTPASKKAVWLDASNCQRSKGRHRGEGQLSASVTPHQKEVSKLLAPPLQGLSLWAHALLRLCRRGTHTPPQARWGNGPAQGRKGKALCDLEYPPREEL